MKNQIVQPVVGIDQDTKGLAWFMMDSANFNYLGHGYLTRKKGTKRVPHFPKQLHSLLDRFLSTGALVYLEDIFCRSKKGYKSLAHAQGEILFKALEVGYTHEFPTVLACVWQKKVFSWYNTELEGTTKEKALVVATELIAPGVVFANEHEVDAACIAAFATWKEFHASSKKKTPFG